MGGMEESNRKKSEKNIGLWLAVIIGPIALFATIFSWMKLPIVLFLPLSILIGLLCGLITYTYLLKQDAKDKDDIIREKDEEINQLRSKLKKINYDKEKKK